MECNIQQKEMCGSPEERLKRFLYLSHQAPIYVTGDAEAHDLLFVQHLEFVTEILKSDAPEKLLNIVEITNGENAVPCRSNLFAVLARALACEDDLPPPLRNKIYTTALNICRSDEDFFDFIKFFSCESSTFSSGVIKVIRRYYLGKEPEELAQWMVRRKGYHTWTHKDLFKLAHLKTEDKVLDVLIKRVMYGPAKAQEAAEDNKEAHKLLDLFTKATEMRNSKDENFVLEHMKDLNFTCDEIPSHLIKSTKIWAHFLDTIDTKDLIKRLPHFYKYGLLKSENPCQAKVIAALSDAERVRASGINPIEAFIGLKNFEKGGKPKDPKHVKYLEEKQLKQRVIAKPVCPPVVSALNKTLMMSYKNVTPTGKRYLITVQISDDMEKPCLTTRNLTGLDAGVMLALYFLRTEKSVTLGVCESATMTTVNLDKGGSVVQALEKLKGASTETGQQCNPLEWARNKKKPIDVFIHMHAGGNSDCNVWRKNAPEVLEKYKTVMNMSTPKLILYNLTEFSSKFHKGNSILQMRGFSSQTPIVIDAFTKHLF